MNKIYKVKFNQRTGQYAVMSEVQTTRTKGTSTVVKAVGALLASAAMSGTVFAQAFGPGDAVTANGNQVTVDASSTQVASVTSTGAGALVSLAGKTDVSGNVSANNQGGITFEKGGAVLGGTTLNSGTLTSSDTLSFAGQWTSTNSTFTNDAWVRFSGSNDITVSGGQFSVNKMDASGRSVIFSGGTTAVIANDLTIGAGSVTAKDSNTTVSINNNVTANGVNSQNGATINFDGVGGSNTNIVTTLNVQGTGPDSVGTINVMSGTVKSAGTNQVGEFGVLNFNPKSQIKVFVNSNTVVTKNGVLGIKGEGISTTVNGTITLSDTATFNALSKSFIRGNVTATDNSHIVLGDASDEKKRAWVYSTLSTSPNVVFTSANAAIAGIGNLEGRTVVTGVLYGSQNGNITARGDVTVEEDGTLGALGSSTITVQKVDVKGTLLSEDTGVLNANGETTIAATGKAVAKEGSIVNLNGNSTVSGAILTWGGMVNVTGVTSLESGAVVKGEVNPNTPSVGGNINLSGNITYKTGSTIDARNGTTITVSNVPDGTIHSDIHMESEGTVNIGATGANFNQNVTLAKNPTFGTGAGTLGINNAGTTSFSETLNVSGENHNVVSNGPGEVALTQGVTLDDKAHVTSSGNLNVTGDTTVTRGAQLVTDGTNNTFDGAVTSSGLDSLVQVNAGKNVTASGNLAVNDTGVISFLGNTTLNGTNQTISADSGNITIAKVTGDTNNPTTIKSVTAQNTGVVTIGNTSGDSDSRLNVTDVTATNGIVNLGSGNTNITGTASVQALGHLNLTSNATVATLNVAQDGDVVTSPKKVVTIHNGEINGTATLEAQTTVTGTLSAAGTGTINAIGVMNVKQGGTLAAKDESRVNLKDAQINGTLKSERSGNVTVSGDTTVAQTGKVEAATGSKTNLNGETYVNGQVLSTGGAVAMTGKTHLEAGSLVQADGATSTINLDGETDYETDSKLDAKNGSAITVSNIKGDTIGSQLNMETQGTINIGKDGFNQAVTVSTSPTFGQGGGTLGVNNAGTTTFSDTTNPLKVTTGSKISSLGTGTVNVDSVTTVAGTIESKNGTMNLNGANSFTQGAVIQADGDPTKNTKGVLNVKGETTFGEGAQINADHRGTVNIENVKDGKIDSSLSMVNQGTINVGSAQTALSGEVSIKHGPTLDHGTLGINTKGKVTLADTGALTVGEGSEIASTGTGVVDVASNLTVAGAIKNSNGTMNLNGTNTLQQGGAITADAGATTNLAGPTTFGEGSNVMADNSGTVNITNIKGDTIGSALKTTSNGVINVGQDKEHPLNRPVSLSGEITSNGGLVNIHNGTQMATFTNTISAKNDQNGKPGVVTVDGPAMTSGSVTAQDAGSKVIFKGWLTANTLAGVNPAPSILAINSGAIEINNTDPKTPNELNQVVKADYSGTVTVLGNTEVTKDLLADNKGSITMKGGALTIGSLGGLENPDLVTTTGGTITLGDVGSKDSIYLNASSLESQDQASAIVINTTGELSSLHVPGPKGVNAHDNGTITINMTGDKVDVSGVFSDGPEGKKGTLNLNLGNNNSPATFTPSGKSDISNLGGSMVINSVTGQESQPITIANVDNGASIVFAPVKDNSATPVIFGTLGDNVKITLPEVTDETLAPKIWFNDKPDDSKLIAGPGTVMTIEQDPADGKWKVKIVPMPGLSGNLGFVMSGMLQGVFTSLTQPSSVIGRRDEGRGAWVELVHDQYTINSAAQPKVKLDGIKAGYDQPVTVGGKTVIVGGMIEAKHHESTMANGKVKGTLMKVGAYAVVPVTDYVHVGVQANYLTTNSNLKSENMNGKHRFNAYQAAAEVGMKLPMGAVTVEPEAQLTATFIKSGKMQANKPGDVAQYSFDMANTKSLVGRIGVRVAAPLAMAGMQAWTRMDAYHEFAGTQKITAYNRGDKSQPGFEATNRGTWMTAQVGLDANLGSVKASASLGTSVGNHKRGFSANVGVKYAF